MRRATLLLLLFLAAGTLEAQNQAAKALHALFDSEWNWEMEQHPVRASLLGDRRWNDRWGDASLEAIQKRHEHRIQALAQLKKIDRSRLPTQDQLNYDLFQKRYETEIEEHQFHWYLAPLNQRGGIQTSDELTESLRFQTLKDYEDWIARLRAFPAYVEQITTLMREGIHRRMVLPKVIMQRIPAQIEKQLADRPEDSPFFKPFRQFPAAIAEAERARLSKAAREAIASGVVPAFRRFRQFFVEEYLPACFDQVGAWQMPRGEEMYAFFARRYTTTAMTPKQIHELGLSEVRRIRAEMQTVMAKTGFRGTLPEFFQFLRTDPRFYYKSPEELLTAYRALAKEVDPNLVKVFRLLPRTPYGVRPIPDAVAPDTTAAYYSQPAADGSRAGTYYVNL